MGGLVRTQYVIICVNILRCVNTLRYLEMALRGEAEFAHEAGEEQSATVTGEHEAPPWFQYPPRKPRSNDGFSKSAGTQSEVVCRLQCETDDASVCQPDVRDVGRET